MGRRPGKVHRRRHRLARGFSVLTLLAIVAVAALATPQGRDWAGEALRDAGWAEKRIRLRLGLPLRGTPDLQRFDERLAEKGVRLGDPVFIRIFKLESELELWTKKGERFVLFATYPVCRWSGRLGPKLKQGDRQSPEGFYTVDKAQLNPNSRWHRSFNLGFPNRYDRAHGRTGSYLMVHGGCGSIGCYAMTNPVIDEIWRLVTAALARGQARFHVQLFPFRMTRWKMALYSGGKWDRFWQDLKAGHDLFQETGVPPVVSICEGRYAVRAGRSGGSASRPIAQNCPRQVSRR